MLALTVNALGWALIHFIWQGLLIGAGYGASRYLLRSRPPVWRYVSGLIALVLLVAAPVWTFIQLLGIDAAVPVALGPADVNAGWQVWAAQALPWVVIVWMIGVCAVSARVVWGWLQLNRLRNQGTWDLPEGWNARIDRLKRAFGVTRNVLVRVSDQVLVPTVMGWMQPLILIPASVVTGLSPQQLELIIAHELGHIRRLDYVVNLLQVMVETLLFYHPIVHWISRHVREDRELCCDDLVLSTCGQPVDYAKALTNLETLRSGWLQPVLNATGGSLLKRVERILFRRDEDNQSSLGAQAMVGLLTLSVVVMSAIRHSPAVAIETVTIRLELPAMVAVPEMPQQIPTTDPVVMWATATRTQMLKPDPMPVLENALLQLARQMVDRAVGREVEPKALAVKDDGQNAGLQRLTETSGLQRKLPTPQASQFRVDHTPLLAGVRLTPAPLSTLPTASFAPLAKHRVAPEYPIRAMLRGEEGTVTVAFAIRPDGSVVDPEVVKEGESRLFNAAALDAIRQWTFDPQSVSRKPGARVTQTFTFSLSGDISGEERCHMVTGSRICHPGPEKLAYSHRG